MREDNEIEEIVLGGIIVINDNFMRGKVDRLDYLFS